MTDLIILPPLLLGLLSYGCTLWKGSFEIKEKVGSVLAILSSGLSLIFSLLSFGMRGRKDSLLPPWISVGDIEIRLVYYLDAWSLTLAIVSSFLTLLIVIFSRYYFGVNSHSAVYYGMIQMFLFGMLLLVLSDNLIFTFFGWEIVGICSWFLIGIYHYKGGEEGKKASLAGQKAILVTGLADVGFLLGLAILGAESSSISSIEMLPSVAAIGLIIAAFGKSAQFPLHIWISSTDKVDIDAMQGPTTVSALIHAATMVNAGVYLTARVISIGVGEEISQFILWVGIISAIYAGMSALGTGDLKRVLAYSTISQLGFMFIALGALGSFAALWHLVNHAFFKALLFLIAGYLIHSVGSRRLDDLRGSVRSRWLKVSLLIGVGALAGFPPLSGFFSKDLILELLVEDANWLAYGFTIFAVFLTGAYSFRLLRILLGEGGQGHEDSVPKFTLISLTGVILLSSGSYFLLIQFPWEHSPAILSLNLYMLASVVVSLLGMVVGYYHDRLTIPSFVQVLVQEGFFVDEILVTLSVGSVTLVSKLMSFIHNRTSFWNFVQFTTATVTIAIAYYFAQYGGYF